MRVGYRRDFVQGKTSCGDRIRTCDLEVMSLASYLLLHPALNMIFPNALRPFRSDKNAKIIHFTEIANTVNLTPR